MTTTRPTLLLLTPLLLAAHAHAGPVVPLPIRSGTAFPGKPANPETTPVPLNGDLTRLTRPTSLATPAPPRLRTPLAGRETTASSATERAVDQFYSRHLADIDAVLDAYINRILAREAPRVDILGPFALGPARPEIELLEDNAPPWVAARPESLVQPRGEEPDRKTLGLDGFIPTPAEFNTGNIPEPPATILAILAATLGTALLARPRKRNHSSKPESES